MKNQYYGLIAENLSISEKQLLSVARLLEEGGTIPFIARYRKEATGNLDEVKLAAIREKLAYFRDLEKRKETVLKTIDEQGKLSPALKEQIEKCTDQHQLEDLYLPYKPKRKTRAIAALEKGLGPLADIIYLQATVNLDAKAGEFLGETVKTTEEALQGARDIIAERVSEDAGARTAIRNLFSREALLTSAVIKSKAEEAAKYRDYFNFSEPLKQCPSHRVLAIRRGEKEGFLSMDIAVEADKAISRLKKMFVRSANACTPHLEAAVEDAYKRLLKPSIETEFRLLHKNKADEEAIAVFSENLRQLLLAAPLGPRRILAIDPGYRTGCKVVLLDEQGSLLENTTVFPHPPQNERERTIKQLKDLVSRHRTEAIAIGNGTAGKETEKLVRSIDFGTNPRIFLVNESGASIYSASEAAREEFPDKDVTVRGAVSIGRRLMDPLSELVKIDPKSIGVGQYQHDVNQTRLKESLDTVVESCVNLVGVDLNTATKHLLNYVSGLGPKLAANIVQYRQQKGAFTSRKELLKVPLLGDKAFEQCAGFLRILNAAHPLDESAVHPESYPVVEKMAADLGCTVAELITKKELRKKIELRKYLKEGAGELTLKDILKELEKPGRDPREELQDFSFAEGIDSIEDLRPGMVLPGVVTNITKFGAFVDIGIKQDGLVHISHLANRFIKDPAEAVKLQQIVRVKVLEIDQARSRVQLSIKEA
ncbi:uncharacterized protein EDD80_10756 [Anseongella ginsenosidimutans]|uniref:S1 motif domain-containing protein n=1 Tax=Anseongella ginsenosidimutans TaxID=496056 RepID=A0A4R3KR13_9SPHI|nr:Tex family protein [Anseongella ginsenosidimutans]QEC52602.1 RNA-binding transcriptional accessory protein [Anseongella ginsenosidimutans]TCS86523.1 uncharacterized protein EDD80_10756 [Anseongella ginsenosidimutans]